MAAPDLSAILGSNPGLKPGALPQPQPGSTVTRVQTVRAQQPGGEILGYVQSPDLLYFEQLYRVLPPTGMFSATPNKPVVFTMGAFRVPRNQVLIILDYSFDIYRFSGAATDDYLPIEENRLSTQVGWDIKVNERRPGSLSFQIIPQAQTQAQQTFSPPNLLAPPQQWEFEAARAQALQGPAGPALSMMPQRHHRDGLVKVNNNYVAHSGDTLNVTCNVINKIPIPIAFFEANVMGLLVPQHVYDAYQAANVPTGNPQVTLPPGASG
jgi:hypothetical protein